MRARGGPGSQAIGSPILLLFLGLVCSSAASCTSIHTGALVYSQKCLEEKNEILQGKLSQLEEHLAQLRENPPREKGEVLGDILQVG